MMLRSRLQYILTWIALAVLLISALGLMVSGWNRALENKGLSLVMALLWVLISASGIFLFLLAVKKAHRLMVDQERSLERQKQEQQIARKESRNRPKETAELDPASMARKLLRRIPVEEGPENWGEALLKNLAREIEIMSGIVWVLKKGKFVHGAVYALPLRDNPEPFKKGEGLPGQAAEAGQVRVITNLPEAHREVYSGLGKAPPAYLAMVPFTGGNKTIAVLECTGYRYGPEKIESMFRILARDLSEKMKGE